MNVNELLQAAGLDEAGLAHLLRKLAEGRQAGFAEIVIVIERGSPRRIKGPTISENIARVQSG